MDSRPENLQRLEGPQADGSGRLPATSGQAAGQERGKGAGYAKRAAERRRFESRGQRDRIASQLLGMDVRSVPKAQLAIVAVYLAARAGDLDDLDAARETFWSEWEILHANGIVPSRSPRATR